MGCVTNSKAWVQLIKFSESVGANPKTSHDFLLNCGSSCTHTFATTAVFSKQRVTKKGERKLQKKLIIGKKVELVKAETNILRCAYFVPNISVQGKSCTWSATYICTKF